MTENEPHEQRRRVVVACQGGGSQTAFTAGVLTELLADPTVEIRALSGTSGGAVCALLAWYGLLTAPARGRHQATRGLLGGQHHTRLLREPAPGRDGRLDPHCRRARHHRRVQPVQHSVRRAPAVPAVAGATPSVRRHPPGRARPVRTAASGRRHRRAQRPVPRIPQPRRQRLPRRPDRRHGDPGFLGRAHPVPRRTRGRGRVLGRRLCPEPADPGTRGRRTARRTAGPRRAAPGGALGDPDRPRPAQRRAHGGGRDPRPAHRAVREHLLPAGDLHHRASSTSSSRSACSPHARSPDTAPSRSASSR